MNTKLWSTILISALVLTACGGGASSGSGDGSSASVVPAVQSVNPSAPVVSPFFYLKSTENCITSSDGWTVNNSVTNNFVMPNQADFAIFKQMNFTCARIPIGAGASQDADYVAEAGAYHDENIRVEGVISTADINNLPTNAVFAASDEIETGNELDVAPNYNPTMAIAYTKAVAIAAQSANSNILIISAGTSGYDAAWLAETIPKLKGIISCVGIHPYGISPGNFGTLATSVKNQYGLPVCYSEFGNTPGNLESPANINTAFTLSQNAAAQFNFFNLGELENSPQEVNAL